MIVANSAHPYCHQHEQQQQQQQARGTVSRCADSSLTSGLAVASNVGHLPPPHPGHFLPDITIAACVPLHLTITVTNSEP